MNLRRTVVLTATVLALAGAGTAAGWLASGRMHPATDAGPDPGPPLSTPTRRPAPAFSSPASLRPLTTPPGPSFRALDTPEAVAAFESWADTDPVAAFAWLETLPVCDNAHLTLVIRRWLDRDLPGLQNHLQTLPAGPWRWQLLGVAGRAALQAGLAPAAVAWLQQLPSDRRPPESFIWAAEVWGASDPQAAAAWILSLPDSEQPETLLGQLAIGRARQDPVEALTLAQRLLPAGDLLDQTRAGIAARWAETEPAAAADWAQNLADETARHDALKLLLYPWSDRDPAAARQWIAGQASPDERDRWWSQLAHWQTQKDPASAAPLLENISAGPARESAALGLVRHWAREDFEQAGDWALQLPAGALRTRLLTELERVVQNTSSPP